MTKMVEALLKYRFTIFVLVIFLLLYGVYSVRKTPIDALPDLTDTQVIIYSEWMGQVPQVIEDQLTYPLVSSMLGLPKVKAVRGYSMPNYSLVYVVFEDGTDIYWARSRVLEKLSSIRSQLPSQARVELGPDATGVGWVYQYALYSESRSLDELLSLQRFYIKYALLSVPNVAEVADVGGFEREYRVVLNPEHLRHYGVSLEDVARAVRGANLETGGKYVEINGREFLIRARGYAKDRADIENAVVKEINGVPIRVKDLGRVVETPALRMGTADLNGMGNTVSGIVVVRYGADAYKTIQEVKKKIEEVKKGLPEDVKILPVYDRSELIQKAIKHLWRVLLEESLVVVLVVAIFLLNIFESLAIIVFLVLSLLGTFILMNHLGVNSNIMSLGGIAIAIGTMVDAGIVLIEAFSRKREEGKDVKTAIVESTAEVGKPIFFALLVVAVSFVPMLALKGQAGRLFGPLVLTKTLAMLVASALSLLVFPVLLYYLGRGRVLAEEKNPIVRALIKLYEPLFRLSVRLRYFILFLVLLSFPLSYFLYESLGREFMPDLREGTLLYMPTTAPGISIQEVQRLLTLQDKVIKSFPEVEVVFGKAGRANTPTDPAPLSMIETIISLKPQEEWRKSMTYEKLISELDRALQFPGVVNSWTMPIKGRIDMISTGIRTPLGIKVFGSDINTLSELVLEFERALQGMEGVMSVYADRLTGSTYVEIIPDREKLALYGLRLEDVVSAVEMLLANSPVSVYISGRERYSITLGVPRDYRQDLENLILPLGDKAVPLKAVAQVKKVESPAEIKSENGLLTAYVYITPKPGADMGKVLQEGERRIKESVKLPSGYYYQWSGQFEYWQKALQDLKLIVPLVLLLVVLLVYLSLGRVFETLLVLLTLPSSLLGGFLLMWLFGYRLSIASIAGFLALLGIAAEMGIVMVVYIMKALQERGDKAFKEAIYEGAVRRIRPKAMTVLAISAGLLPAVYLKGVGAEVISRIAMPMLGGVISSFLTALFVVPALYSLKR
ncbi:heavy metal efflux pump, CzcA family [Hydrogenobacter thermophilus TK-6]|uniref:Cation efflux system protein n=1 Tax=Hydrogenobacter thermophilus (strain DSM 6534 / IAM 12695 / TK-6) TaxID=608538 RepID=D3DKA4_HYDTT|nr:CusA/CzcA family heavy metal efflux RND transporter [Hydrogenobacter thermophilus]ADO46176.1 heavy metal efflux pump, CzcA family [Hydrogenobacter thermophilus TK-6]BAI70256.1 cation efflux system protein [Hydrogenobacter thermophilus TK-6]